MVAVREPAAAGIGISLCNRVLRQPPMKLAPAKVAIYHSTTLLSKVQLNLGRNVEEELSSGCDQIVKACRAEVGRGAGDGVCRHHTSVDKPARRNLD